jgi:dipeptidase E
MKLFLSSLAISFKQRQPFMDLVGKSTPNEVKIALIENAADPYEEGKKDWMYDNRHSIEAHGFEVDLVDLDDYRQGKKGLLERLQRNDAIWLGGGNTYYLRWILKEAHADKLIKGLVARGQVYGGGSAGAIVAGPTLKYFEAADDPKAAPEAIYEGLGLTETVVVPHWASEQHGELFKSIEKNLQKDGYETVHLTDDQALVIDGASREILA